MMKDKVDINIVTAIIASKLFFFINQWYSQHTEGNPTSPPPLCLNKKGGFKFNTVKLHITKQVSSKTYSNNIYINYLLS